MSKSESACCVCKTRPVEISAPRGWDSNTNAPATAGECLECAVMDGWIIECDGMVRCITYHEWDPSPGLVAEIAKDIRGQTEVLAR